MRKASKKAIALLLSVIMVLGMAPVSIFASAADGWTYVEGTKYEPVTVYERQSSMTTGNTYLVDVANSHYFVKYVTGDTSFLYVQAPIITKGSTNFSNYSADKYGTALSNDIIVDETGDTYKYVELKWNSTTGRLSNPTSGAYLAPYSNSGSYIATIFTTDPGVKWTYSNNSFFSIHIRNFESSIFFINRTYLTYQE